MTDDYAARIARGAKLTPGQHDKFLYGSLTVADVAQEGVKVLREMYEAGAVDAEQLETFLSHMAGFETTIPTQRRSAPLTESETP